MWYFQKKGTLINVLFKFCASQLRMKLFIKTILFCSITCCYIAGNAQSKRALIIAIGNYDPESKIAPIASVNDIKYIKQALQNQGFKPGSIDTLIDAQATKKGILASLENLINKSAAGDVVVLHFSCHGQQIRDQKTPELGKDEEDGYDEAFLAYDAMAKYSPSKYRGENHLRDDELGEILSRLRKKLGAKGNVLVMLDACHSGTGTRDESFAATRGEPIPFPDPENPMEAVINIKGIENMGLALLAGTDLASQVVFSASSPHQVNKQIFEGGEEVGSLSYSFYKALNNMRAGSTYQLLFEKIKNNIQVHIPEQIPMMEGDGNQLIFSGAYTATGNHHYIQLEPQSAVFNDNSRFSINKGGLDFLKQGLTGKIYKAGDDQFVCNARIEHVLDFTSFGVAQKELKKDELYEIVFDEENLGSLSTVLSIVAGTDKKTSTAAKDLGQYLQNTKLVSVAEGGNYQIKIDAINNAVKMVNRNNDLMWTSDLGAANTISEAGKKELLEVIKNDARLKFLRALPDGGLLNEFFEVNIKVNDSVAKSGLHVAEGELYELHLVNNSDDNLYYTVIDIYPNDKMDLLYPYKGKEPADYFVPKGTTVVRKLKVSANSPRGVEFLKTIVSKEPMDLRSVFENKVTRAEAFSFTGFLNDVLNNNNLGNNTRAEPSPVNPQEIGIITSSINVK